MWAINPIQWFATPDGWLDPTSGPELPALLEEIKRAGFDAMHAAAPGGMAAGEYAELLAQANVRPAPGYMTVLHDDGNESALSNSDDLKRAAATHAELGLSDMFVALKMHRDHPRVAEHAGQGYLADHARLSRLVELFARAADCVVTEGVRPLLHPHVGTWIETESETRYILDHVPLEAMGFGPDLGHLTWSGADIPSLLHTYADRIGAVHIKDINLSVLESCRRASAPYRATVTQGLWAPPGKGGLPLAEYLSALSADKPVWLISEVDWVAEDPFSAARASAEWFQSYCGGRT
ncbi:xylose isomerase domain-containing protein [Acetobacter nitrogenifigens DSM 23921 = NBRC 105050]|nr:xylose isomerase domain-containing protein [Acetobacter nitrogenifigens DSM 23921 = NBRC 105050]